tara:strand:+ start:609 stop:1802 length:1194 start_codon:yes stop_codon:yes gene_type:complete
MNFSKFVRINGFLFIILVILQSTKIIELSFSGVTLSDLSLIIFILLLVIKSLNPLKLYSFFNLNIFVIFYSLPIIYNVLSYAYYEGLTNTFVYIKFLFVPIIPLIKNHQFPEKNYINRLKNITTCFLVFLFLHFLFFKILTNSVFLKVGLGTQFITGIGFALLIFLMPFSLRFKELSKPRDILFIFLLFWSFVDAQKTSLILFITILVNSIILNLYKLKKLSFKLRDLIIGFSVTTIAIFLSTRFYEMMFLQKSLLSRIIGVFYLKEKIFSSGLFGLGIGESLHVGLKTLDIEGERIFTKMNSNHVGIVSLLITCGSFAAFSFLFYLISKNIENMKTQNIFNLRDYYRLFILFPLAVLLVCPVGDILIDSILVYFIIFYLYMPSQLFLKNIKVLNKS